MAMAAHLPGQGSEVPKGVKHSKELRAPGQPQQASSLGETVQLNSLTHECAMDSSRISKHHQIMLNTTTLACRPALTHLYS